MVGAISAESAGSIVWAWDMKQEHVAEVAPSGFQRAGEQVQGAFFQCPPPATYFLQLDPAFFLPPPSKAIVKIHQGVDPFIISSESS